MDTAQEALFRAMLNNGWFTASDGDVESPTGYFGYVTNTWGDFFEVLQTFEDTIKQYGVPPAHQFYGSFTAVINDQGIIRVVKWENENNAKQVFDRAVEQYNLWEAS